MPPRSPERLHLRVQDRQHGGVTLADRHVPLIVAGPGIAHRNDESAVSTAQIAPTILKSARPRSPETRGRGDRAHSGLAGCLADGS